MLSFFIAAGGAKVQVFIMYIRCEIRDSGYEGNENYWTH